jgi:hypothetical protein
MRNDFGYHSTSVSGVDISQFFVKVPVVVVTLSEEIDDDFTVMSKTTIKLTMAIAISRTDAKIQHHSLRARRLQRRLQRL